MCFFEEDIIVVWKIVLSREMEELSFVTLKMIMFTLPQFKMRVKSEVSLLQGYLPSLCLLTAVGMGAFQIEKSNEG